MNRRKFILNVPYFATALSAASFIGCDSDDDNSGSAHNLPPANRSYDYDLCFVPAYGQSLSLGERGSPALSVVQRFDSLMFAGGLIAEAYSSDLATVYGSLVPLVENDSLVNFSGATTGIANPGETPESGMFEAIKELMQQQDGLGVADISYRFLGSCPGRGAYMITQLSQGTVPYARLLYEVAAGMTQARQLGLTFGVPCVTWMQGESDYATSMDVYLADLKAFYEEMNHDILAITGQSKPVQFIMYQTAHFNSFQAAAAQFQLTQINPNVHVGTPCYPFRQTSRPGLIRPTF